MVHYIVLWLHRIEVNTLDCHFRDWGALPHAAAIINRVSSEEEHLIHIQKVDISKLSPGIFDICSGGGMADTAVLEAAAERCAGSSPVLSTSFDLLVRFCCLCRYLRPLDSLL